MLTRAFGVEFVTNKGLEMKPFLKWAGGKRWLFNDDFIAALPDFSRYIEPFVGGGAGFFALEPENAIISDVNVDLITLYRVIRDNAEEFTAALEVHQQKHNKEYYYHIRALEPECKIERAARFLYLNRTCWNGLYRLNKLGQFNVPIGSKTQVLLDTDDFARVAKLLSGAEIKHSDFEAIIDLSGAGDLVFIDPPYTVAHNANGFVKYNEKIFTWQDQIRLRDVARRAVSRGATIILTNADHHSVHELYSGIGAGRSISRASVISGSAKGRSGVTEYLLRIQCTG